MSSTVAIAIPADLESARNVLGSGRRLARRLGLGWVAVLVQTRNLERETVRRLLDLAKALGGEVACTVSEDVVGGLVELSRREHAQILVIGSSRRPRLMRRLFPGTTERLLRARRSFDVVVAGQGAEH